MPPPGLDVEDSTEAESDESSHTMEMMYGAGASYPYSWGGGWGSWDELALHQMQMAAMAQMNYSWPFPPGASLPPPGQWDMPTVPPPLVGASSMPPPHVAKPPQEAPCTVLPPSSPPPPPPGVPVTKPLPTSSKKEVPATTTTKDKSPSPRRGAEGDAPASSPVVQRESSSQSDFPLLPSLLEDVPTELIGKESLSVERIDKNTLVVEWMVKESRLKSMDKQAASPAFDFPLDAIESNESNESNEAKKTAPSIPFRLMIVPAARNDGRGAGSFKQAKGRGRVSLKCLDPGSNNSLAMSIVVKMEAGGEPPRGPLVHDFLEKSCFECPHQAATDNAWNFGAAVDPGRKVFAIRVEVTRHELAEE